MSKVSVRPRRHNLEGLRNHYETLRRPDEEFHPVDKAVEARLHHGAVRRRLRQLQTLVMKALGAKSNSFLQFEALSNDERREREEAYFNLGYEYGATSVRHRVMRQMVGRTWPERLEHVATRLRDEVLQAGLSSSETLLVLAESLWVLAVRNAPAPDQASNS
jgi:hypothetical protein